MRRDAGIFSAIPIDGFRLTVKVKRMKILIYSANFAPEPTGIGKYSGEMAAWLSARGHEVRAVAAPPYYPQWRVSHDYRWPPYRREHWNSVDVWRAPLWVPASPRGLTVIGVPSQDFNQ